MDFRRTEEQELLLESLRELVARYGTEEYITKCEENHEFPTELAQAFHDAGFDMLGVPEELGGTPSDTMTMVMLHEELARICSGHYALGSPAHAIADISLFGNEAQMADCVQALEELKRPFALGFTEPQAGSDSAACATTWRRREDGKIVLNGRKTFITCADRVNHMLLLTRNPEPTDPRKVFTTWWVPMDLPGITVKPIPKIGWHMVNSCEVSIDDVVIDESAMVGKEGMGFINVMKNFEVERMVMAAGALGEARMAFEDAAAYASQRVQFGKPIGSNQMIMQKLVDMRVKIINMQNMLYRTAWMMDEGMEINTHAAMTKYYCANASSEVIDEAIQIMGGLGYSSEVRLGRLWRNNRICGIGGGTKEIMVRIAGKATVKEYADRDVYVEP